jgi:hypothetical protein
MKKQIALTDPFRTNQVEQKQLIHRLLTEAQMASNMAQDMAAKKRKKASEYNSLLSLYYFAEGQACAIKCLSGIMDDVSRNEEEEAIRKLVEEIPRKTIRKWCSKLIEGACTDGGSVFMELLNGCDDIDKWHCHRLYRGQITAILDILLILGIKV